MMENLKKKNNPNQTIDTNPQVVQIYKLADKEFLITIVCSKNKGKDGQIYEKKNSIQSLESIKNQMDTWPMIGNINRMWQK